MARVHSIELEEHHWTFIRTVEAVMAVDYAKKAAPKSKEKAKDDEIRREKAEQRRARAGGRIKRVR